MSWGVAPFLSKTHEMVDDRATDDIVSWSGDTSFIVKDPGEFAQNILPCYFKHNNLSSFVRQLNIYGFRKVNTEGWEFSHEYFRRSNPAMLKTIKRRKSSNRESSKASPAEPALFEPSSFDNGPVHAQPVTLPMQQPTTLHNPMLQQMLHQSMPPQAETSPQASSMDTDALFLEVIELRKRLATTQQVLAATLNELHETQCEQRRTQDTVEKIVGFLGSAVEAAEGFDFGAIGDAEVDDEDIGVLSDGTLGDVTATINDGPTVDVPLPMTTTGPLPPKEEALGEAARDVEALAGSVGGVNSSILLPPSQPPSAVMDVFAALGDKVESTTSTTPLVQSAKRLRMS